MIGLETRPEYTSYEVTEDMTAEDNANTAEGTGAATDGGENGNAADNTTGAIDSDTPQIRIFDGEVQWFDGKYWVSAGAVREMAKQDPFAAYEENHDTTASGSVTGSITGKSPAVQMATVQPVTMGRRSPAAEPCRETRPAEVFRNLQPPRIPAPRQSQRPNLLRQSLQSLRPLRPHRLRPRNLHRMMTMTTMMTAAAVIPAVVIPAATIAEAVTAAVPVETAAEVM